MGDAAFARVDGVVMGGAWVMECNVCGPIGALDRSDDAQAAKTFASDHLREHHGLDDRSRT